jgi:hypothetical protein
MFREPRYVEDSSRKLRKPLTRHRLKTITLSDLLSLALRAGIDAIGQLSPSGIATITRQLQWHVRVCPEREQLLFSVNAEFETPVARSVRVDQHVQAAAIEYLVRLLARLGGAYGVIREHWG